MTRLELFATCAPGIEPVLAAELRGLALARVEQQTGGAYFMGTMADVWRACLELRTAVRVLVRVARFPAAGAEDVYTGALEVDWERWVAPDGTLAVRAHAPGGEVRSTMYLAQRVKDAVVDRLRGARGLRPSVDKEDPQLLLHAHLTGGRCTLLADAAGASLHKRGWRRFQGRAPLAETTAAAAVLLSGWDRRSPLVDPFCGSGTLLVEAALLAAGVPPGSFRERFGFERWPGHDARGFARLRAEARRPRTLPPKLVLAGCDADETAVAGALENVAAAGFGGRIDIERRSALDLDLKRGWGAWIVGNLPYGRRVGDARDLPALYRGFGRLLCERCRGYHVALLTGDRALARELGWEPARRVAVANGAIPCELLVGEI